MNKRGWDDTINRSSFDLSLLSDSSSDTQTNPASDYDASENCTLLLQTNEQPENDRLFDRIAQYTKRRPIFRREGSWNGTFYASSRQIHTRTIKRYVFLFGVVSTFIIFSQLCLSLYNYEPDVEGLFAWIFTFIEYNIQWLHSFIYFAGEPYAINAIYKMRDERNNNSKECIYQYICRYFSYQVGIEIGHVTRQRMYCQMSTQPFCSRARCAGGIHQYCYWSSPFQRPATLNIGKCSCKRHWLQHFQQTKRRQTGGILIDTNHKSIDLIWSAWQLHIESVDLFLTCKFLFKSIVIDFWNSREFHRMWANVHW